MSYEALRRLDITFRPIDVWAGPLNPDRRHSPFLASLTSTVGLLERELRMLVAEQIVLQVAIEERDLRLDGLPRADARPAHPGVVIAFGSRWGPLKYATDEFYDWKDNVRAVALSMEALRKVDRYGVSKRGEQYQGWRAIPQTAGSTDPATLIPDRDAATRFLSEWGGDVRRAQRATHPDHHPDDPQAAHKFALVMRSAELVA